MMGIFIHSLSRPARTPAPLLAASWSVYKHTRYCAFVFASIHGGWVDSVLLGGIGTRERPAAVAAGGQDKSNFSGHHHQNMRKLFSGLDGTL